MKYTWFTLILSMLACSGTTTEPGTHATSEPILMFVHGWTMRRDFTAQRALEIGDTLSSGDYFYFWIRVNTSAHIYVLQFLPDGRAKVLFPKNDPIRFQAEKELRVPTDPSMWFQLDQSPGREYLYIIASGQPLETVDKSLAAIVKNIRLSGSTAAPAPSNSSSPSPPKPASEFTDRNPSASARDRMEWKMRLDPKGVNTVRVLVGGNPVYQGRTGDNGVGVMPFPFEHR